MLAYSASHPPPAHSHSSRTHTHEPPRRHHHHASLPKHQHSGNTSSSSAGPSASTARRSRSVRRPTPSSSATTTAVEEPTVSRSQPASPVPSSPPLSKTTQPPPATARRQTPPDTPPPITQSTPNPSQLDIANYPSADLLKLLAALLGQIASANDALRAQRQQRSPVPRASPSSSVSAHDAATITTQNGSGAQSGSSSSPRFSFHARNIPTISIEAYLLRILKYCPTTNEVFLSLLVYFDRMSKKAHETDGNQSGLDPSFAIDSFNVHRLIIAGITVASKFFSDVFYLNSRYAKVGGLPLSELNQLETQFLLLNDFRLIIPPEEMQRYADQLLVYSNSHPTTASHPVSPAVPPPREPSRPSSSIPQGLPTPNPSPTSSRISPQNQIPDSQPSVSYVRPGPYPFQQTSHERSTSSVGDEESGYGTTDDEPTIRPDDSSGSSIYTVSSASSARTSVANTPASSPRRAATRPRWSVSSAGRSFVGEMIHAGEDEDEDEEEENDDADTDGEGDGDETDDEMFGSRLSSRNRTRDTRMASP